jgi:hypothetical protein
MSAVLEPALHGAVCVVALWLIGLRLAAACGRPVHRSGVAWAIGAGAVVLLFVPWDRRPLWTWAFSVCPNPSFLLLGILVDALRRVLGGRSWLRPADRHMTLGFAALSGTVLYLHPMLLPGLDLYYWGWHHEVAVWSLAALALATLLAGSRLGVMFCASLIGYELAILDSHNAWDYVIDPICWLAGCAFLAMRALARVRQGGRVKSVAMMAEAR